MSDTETLVEAELVVGGMTCGACAARIERRLNRLDGVVATVNYATGRTHFSSLAGRDPDELIGVIASTGYPAELPAPPAPDGVPPGRPRVRGAGPAARRLPAAGGGGTEQRVPAGSLVAGEEFVVRPGEKIATDGVVTEGSSAVDASLVTGESMPSEVGPGDEVTGATVNMSGR